jgi:hypothetical protein
MADKQQQAAAARASQPVAAAALESFIAQHILTSKVKLRPGMLQSVCQKVRLWGVWFCHLTV